MPASARSLVVWLILVIVAVGVATIIFGFSATRLYSTIGLVDHTHRVLGKNRELLSHLLDAETGQRGYLLTNDDAYLTPYRSALQSVHADLANLQLIVGDNPVQVRRVEMLKPLVALKLTELDRTISMHSSGQTDSAILMVRTDSGKATMDAIRAALTELGAEEEALLDQRTADLRISFLYTGIAAIIALAGGLPTLMVLGLQLGRSESRQSMLRRALEDSHRTLEKRVEARTVELTESHQALTEALLAKDRFLANMTHELRSPLNAVIGFAEMMEQKVHGPLNNRQYEEYVSHIVAGGRHLLGLINDLLDMARLQVNRFTLNLEPVDPSGLLRGSFGLMQATAGKAGVLLRLELDNPPQRIEADAGRLRQIVLNLLSNAIKFTPAGHQVLLRGQATADGRLQISVIDQGVGIAPEDLQRILKPFEQVDNEINRRQSGTGLGLPLTVSLIELHGGSFTLDSTPSKGTTATVII